MPVPKIRMLCIDLCGDNQPKCTDIQNTRIGLYRNKQAKHTDSFERKIRAFDGVLDHAMGDPANTVALRRAVCDKWVAENQKTYGNHVQAAYMDWVTLGKEAQYCFVVETNSVTSRVEAGKVCGFTNT